jgi:hypothetical protein
MCLWRAVDDHDDITSEKQLEILIALVICRASWQLKKPKQINNSERTMNCKRKVVVAISAGVY